MQLVIMAAGMGSRFGGLKQLEPIDQNGNFIIDYSIPLPGESKYNATIARKDVVRTFVSCGATFMNWHPITTLSIPKIKCIINRVGDLFQAIIGLRKIKREEKVYFQYPYLALMY